MKNFLSLLAVTCMYAYSFSQGCVAVRPSCGAGGAPGNGAILMKGDLLFTTNFRYFESYKHFRGKEEEENRVEEGTQVINNSFFADLTLSYGITNRWYATAVIPMAYHLRSSMYEHGGNPPNGLGERHETSSFGLSDIRFGGGYWLFNPEEKKNYNYAIGLGVKLPNGNYEAKDDFYNQGTNEDSIQYLVVDQSIQLGDGGYGITLDIQGFQKLSEKFYFSTNLYYMSNPMTDNGVLTRNKTMYFSCPDQYAARLGFTYVTPIKGLMFNLGGRWEGVPSKDLIGSSAGYRRPGYAISVDPGLTYIHNNFSAIFGMPIAVERNRVQSYDDIQVTNSTGVYKIGDAAFADYVFNLSIAYKLGTKKDHSMSVDILE